uniref:non-specific serine/threonine protein kinase n=1 Tax=Sinocyclocheilus grahami TaxID=75366 RepID=A0A672L7K3_SINGR
MNTIGVSFLDPLDDYEIIHLIGSGTYGEVFKARNIRSSEMAAIKIVKLDPGDDITSIQQEITMMKECKHKNIVAYYGTYHRYSNVCELPTGEPSAQIFAPIYTYSALGFRHRRLKLHILDYCIPLSFSLCLSLSLSLSVADFGVAAEISVSVAKRKSFIGTPYCDSAPDTIQSKGKHMPVERSLSEEQCKFWLTLSLLAAETEYKHLHLTYYYKRKSGLFSPPPVSATTSLPPMSSLDSNLEDKDLTLRPSATLCPETVLSPKSALLRCSGSQDVRHWCSDPYVPDGNDTQDKQRTLTRTLSRDTALSPEWSTMRKKTEDSRADSHGLPPTPQVYMGACFTKVFNGCPLKIHCAETWILPKTRDQYLILGAEEGVYILNLNELHEDTLEKLLPQRCTWLYVMNNVLMSISGKSSHLYSHRLTALFEQRGHLQRKQGHMSLGTNRFTERIIHRKFAVSVKIADTKGSRKCSVARNPYTDSTFLCAAVPSGLVLLLWYEPLQKFMHLKHIAVPLPDPLPIFELLVLMTDELPQLCVGVQESLQQQNERQLKFDIIHLNGTTNPQQDCETIRAVQVTQLDRDTVLIALEKTVKIVNMQGVPSKELASELEFDFPIETLVCLEESVLAFWRHGLKGLSLHNCEITQEISDKSRQFKVLGTHRDIVLQSTPTENPSATSNLYILTGHESSY